jgi:hypothetical protein
VLKQAIETYVALVREVAAAWRTYHPTQSRLLTEPDPKSGRGEVYVYRASLDIEESRDIARLSLERLRADGNVDWPSIVAIGPDGGDIQARRVHNDKDGRWIHEFSRQALSLDRRGGGDATLWFVLTFEPLHVVRHESVLARLWVERNAALAGWTEVETQAPFVYRSPPVSFAKPLRPAIIVDSRITIGRWSDDAAANPLRNVLDMISTTDNPISIRVSHEGRLPAAPQPLATETPLFLTQPHVPEATEIQQLVAAIRDWRGAHGVVDGAFKFEISVYGSLEGASFPLLVLRQVVSPIGAVATD